MFILYYKLDMHNIKRNVKGKNSRLKRRTARTRTHAYLLHRKYI